MDDADKHDETTIKAIKKNISGLERISGERIWSEWNKILTGKFAMELTLKLLECGTNEYIGIPKQIDVDNFQIVYQRALANNITLKPISLIISMLRDECEVMTLHKRLKLSNSERDLAFFLIQHREPKLCMDNPLRPYQSLVFVQSTNKHNVYREYIKEVLKYLGAMQLLDEFEKWVIPRFPISGESLRKYDVERPKTYGYIINRLKQIWVTEDFKLTTEQLMQKIPDIIDEVEGRK